MGDRERGGKKKGRLERAREDSMRKWKVKAEVERESGSVCVERKMTERKRRGAAGESGCAHGGWGEREISFKITG